VVGVHGDLFTGLDVFQERATRPHARRCEAQDFVGAPVDGDALANSQLDHVRSSPWERTAASIGLSERRLHPPSGSGLNQALLIRDRDGHAAEERLIDDAIALGEPHEPPNVLVAFPVLEVEAEPDALEADRDALVLRDAERAAEVEIA